MWLELHISLIDLVLINFEFFRIQWTTSISDINIDCNHTIVHDTLYTGKCAKSQHSNFFIAYTCAIDKNTILYIIDLSTTNETLNGLVLNHTSIVQRYWNWNIWII